MQLFVNAFVLYIISTGLNFISKEQALKEGTRELGANPAEFAGQNPFTGEIELQLKPIMPTMILLKTLNVSLELIVE